MIYQTEAKCKFARKKDNVEHFMRGQTTCFMVVTHGTCLDHRNSQVSHKACSIMFKGRPFLVSLFSNFVIMRTLLNVCLRALNRTEFAGLPKSRFMRYIHSVIFQLR